MSADATRQWRMQFIVVISTVPKKRFSERGLNWPTFPESLQYACIHLARSLLRSIGAYEVLQQKIKENTSFRPLHWTGNEWLSAALSTMQTCPSMFNSGISTCRDRRVTSHRNVDQRPDTHISAERTCKCGHLVKYHQIASSNRLDWRERNLHTVPVNILTESSWGHWVDVSDFKGWEQLWAFTYYSVFLKRPFLFIRSSRWRYSRSELKLVCFSLYASQEAPCSSWIAAAG